MFKALRIHRSDMGIRAVMQSMSADELTDGEVLIRVQYSSINYKDALAGTGAGKILRKFPLNGGIDLAGVVERSDAPQFRAGQAVLVTGCGLSETLDGGYAEYARVPASAVIVMPEGLDALSAMTLGTAGFTAALAIDRLEHNGLAPCVVPGSSSGALPVAVTGATGGVGSIAIDMLSARGYEVCAITGKPQERDYLLSLGATQVCLRDELLRGEGALEPTRYAAGIDSLGGQWLSWLLRSVSLMGGVASIGLAADSELTVSVMPFILRGINLLGITSANTPRALREHVWRRIATDLKPRHLRAIRTRIVALADVPSVLPNYLRGTVRGRTVVHVQD
jgi:acrylyl-CoA reductase (NADPH)